MSNNKEFFEKFTGLYSISKTLRFELIPQGDTLKNIKNNGLIEKDKKRSENYKEMKKTLDEYHRYFIETAFKSVKLTKLNEYMELYCASAETKKTEKFKEDFDKIKSELRKEVVNCFKADDVKKIFDILDKKDLIKHELEDWKNREGKECFFDPDFKTFTTYFKGYNTNRMNMYSADEKSTSIAYRIVNENLPKFIDNIKIFEMVAKTDISNKFYELYKNLKWDLDTDNINELFKLEYFNKALTQSQIDIYNTVIGGKTNKDGTKVQGLNEYINLYNQKLKDKKYKLPKLKQLYKQILSPSYDIHFLSESFESIQQLLDSISYFFDTQLRNNETIETTQTINVLEKIRDIIFDLKEFDLNKIFIRNDSSITGISQKIFGDYSFIGEAISQYYDININPDYKAQYENTKNKEKKQREKEKFTKQSYLSVKLIQDAVDIYINRYEQNDDSEYSSTLHNGYSATCIVDYFKNYFYSEEFSETGKKFDFISNIMAKYSCVKGLLNTEFKEKELLQVQKDNIKIFLDSILEMIRHIKPLYLKNSDEYNADDRFYSSFLPLFEQLREFTKLYDKVRNFLTKKPFSTKKYKLNFKNNGNFLGGWSDSKTENSDNGTQYGGYLFRKRNFIGKYDYYLGISDNTKLFRSSSKVNEDDISEYERLNYYQLPEKNIYGILYKGENSYSYDRDELLRIIDNIIESIGNGELKEAVKNDRNLKTSKTNTPSGCLNFIKSKFKSEYNKIVSNSMFLQQNNIIITNLKKTLSDLNRVPMAKEYAEKNYNLFTEILNDIKELCKEKVFEYFPVSQSEMNSALNNTEKPLFMFKISNKDLSFSENYENGKRKGIGNKNLHTLYFEALMSGNQNTYDIGTGEVFYRERSIKYNPEILKNGHHHKLLKDKFRYPILENKRYSVDKFLFHLSININYKSEKNCNVNKDVLEYLKNNPDVNIIGIDRGERNLLYISLIDQKGNVILDEDGNPVQHSLNKTVNKYFKDGESIEKTIDYHDKLNEKEKERANARENWGVIESIKELKEGYLSQVIHFISKLMLKYNAIVVMEDLNFGFKRGRFKVEKQVYQKFEKMLIDKLNYLVFKDKDSDELGGIYKALQLTSKFESFEKLGKQCGFIFYVPAWNTSKIDPVTGFVNFLKPKYTSIKDAKNFFAKFDCIRFNKEKDYFEFAFDYNNFTNQVQESRNVWKVCSYGDERYTFNKSLNNNKGGYEKWKVTKKIKELLKEYNISYENGKDIKGDLENVSDSKFFITLIKCLNVILAIRYSSSNEGRDYILSPVSDEYGNFFYSETADKTMPQDADANGAYHIAKKGLLILDKISKAEDLNKLKLSISNTEWLNFVQNKKYQEN